jgi:hypothetical protein
VEGDKGHPDLVLVRPPRLVYAELKSDAGRLAAEQQAWLADLRACGVEAYVWRPGDWDAIEGLLADDPPADAQGEVKPR